MKMKGLLEWKNALILMKKQNWRKCLEWKEQKLKKGLLSFLSLF